MQNRKVKPQRIGFVGDAWLKKVADVFGALYGANGSVYVVETAPQDKIDEALAGCDAVIGTWHAEAAQSRDILCPRFNIDGLCTIEMSGAGGNRTFLGAAPLLERIDKEQDMKIIVSALKGEVEFACAQRFETSLDALLAQEEIALAISDFLKGTHQSAPVLTGCKKPAPVTTVEMARRVAQELSLDVAAFDAVDHLLRGSLAIKASRRCTMPYDAQKLGLRYDPDPFWFPTFGGLFKDITGDFRKAMQ